MEKMTIKQIRVGLNMTQKQMAKYLGISPVSYTNKEIGKRRFYFDEVKRICELAKISIDVVKIEVAKAIKLIFLKSKYTNRVLRRGE